MGDLSPEYVSIAAPSIGLRLVVRLGDGAPVTTGGVGGFETVARPFRRPLTIWRGPGDALQMTLPLLFDGWGQVTGRAANTLDGLSVEADVRALERMGGLDRGDPTPPLLTIEGALPHDESRAPQNRWVLQTIEWGDAIRRTDGHRVRQAATATFLEFTEDDTLRRVRPRAVHPRYRHIKARKGDTFEKVAARELGTRRLGGRLARLNGKRSPDVALRTSTPIRVPTGDLLAAWKKDLKRRT